MKKIILLLMLVCFQLQASEINNKTDKDDNLNELNIQIDQNRIISNMRAYLVQKGRDANVINKGGVCNGLAFLVQYYANIGREDEFFTCLESMSAWDGTQSSLMAPTSLPHIYSTLEKLFDQWINDISWFQQTYLKVATLPNLEISNQRRRVLQYEMIKGNSETKEIGVLSSPILYNGINADQLAELLWIWTWYPNTVIEFAGSRHATSARVSPDGTISYYDPNIPFRLNPFYSTMDVVHVIQKFKYELLDFPSDKMVLEVMAYQYVEKGQSPLIPEAVQFIKNGNTGSKSPNGFTPLHLAIYANDYEYFLNLLEQTKCDPNKEDKHGISPLYLATAMWKQDFVLALLNHPKIKINTKTRLSPLMAAILNFNVDAAEMLLIKGGDLFVTSFEQQGIQQLLEKNQKTRVFAVPAVAICCMQKEELDFVKELCRRVPEILYRTDREGRTLLQYAILFENRDLYQILIKGGH